MNEWMNEWMNEEQQQHKMTWQTLYLSFVDTTVKLVEYSNTDNEHDSQQEYLSQANNESVDMFLDVETRGNDS